MLSGLHWLADTAERLINASSFPRFTGIGYLTDGFARVLLTSYVDYEAIFLLTVAVPG